MLYRAIREEGRFKKLGLSIYALRDYTEEAKPDKANIARMHSYIEGICIDIGNMKDFDTYTPDVSAKYRDNVTLRSIATVHEVPAFSYDEIVGEVRRIDVIWFNKAALSFPQKVFEVVDNIGTLNSAFNRSLQLQNFRTEFFIVAPEKHKEKYEHTIRLAPYNRDKERFRFVFYDDILALYDNVSNGNKLEAKIFGK